MQVRSNCPVDPTELVTHRTLRPARREELPLADPGFAVGREGVTQPVEGARGELGEGPARGGAVGANAKLDDVVTAAPADLVLVVVAGGIGPGDAPGLEGWIPGAQGSAVHVLGRVGRRARAARRHDPGVEDGAALEDPRGVELAGEAAAGDVDARIVADLEAPAADEEAVEVGRLRDVRRAAGGDE